MGGVTGREEATVEIHCVCVCVCVCVRVCVCVCVHYTVSPRATQQQNLIEPLHSSVRETLMSYNNIHDNTFLTLEVHIGQGVYFGQPVLLLLVLPGPFAWLIAESRESGSSNH